MTIYLLNIPKNQIPAKVIGTKNKSEGTSQYSLSILNIVIRIQPEKAISVHVRVNDKFYIRNKSRFFISKFFLYSSNVRTTLCTMLSICIIFILRTYRSEDYIPIKNSDDDNGKNSPMSKMKNKR